MVIIIIVFTFDTKRSPNITNKKTFYNIKHLYLIVDLYILHYLRDTHIQLYILSIISINRVNSDNNKDYNIIKRLIIRNEITLQDLQRRLILMN